MARPGAQVDELYRRFGPAIFRRCLKLLRDPAEAEDATQEVFVRVFRSLDRFTSDKLVELLAKAQVFYGRKGLFRLPGSGRRLWTDMREDLLDRLRMRARVLESQGD